MQWRGFVPFWTSDTAATLLLALMLLNYLGWLLGVPVAFLVALLALFLIAFGASVISFPTQRLVAIIFIAAVSAIALSRPITDWDGRSIWFFHAKRMLVEGAIPLRLDGYPGFDHADYPDLIPALAATLMLPTGIWNEVLPKAALVLALLPPLLICLHRCPGLHAKLLLIGTIGAIGKSRLTGGSMDALLALYSSAAVVLIADLSTRGKEEFKSNFTAAAALCATLGALTAIKNEGLVLAALLFACALGAKAFRFISATAITRLTIFGVAALAPTLVWRWILQSTGTSVDLAEGEFCARFIDRLSSREALVIIGTIGRELALSTFLLGAAWIAGVARPFVFGLVVAYAGVLTVVYFGTPLDVGYHLRTSASRVMTTVKLVIAIHLVVELSRMISVYPRLPKPSVR